MLNYINQGFFQKSKLIFKKSWLSMLLGATIFAVECLIWFMVLLIWDVVVMFEFIPSCLFSGIVRMIIISIFIIFLEYQYCRLLWIPVKDGFKKLRKYSLVLFGFSALYTYLFMKATEGVWTCYHNEDVDGITIGNDRHFSTAMSRGLAQSTCPGNILPCFAYITLPEEALEGVFFNFHINPVSWGNDGWKPILYVGDLNTVELKDIKWKEFMPVKGEYEVPRFEYERRNVFSTLVTGLKPAQSYVFKVAEHNWK